MSDDRCGYEGTTTGEPCRHPADSCPVPSHSDPDAENPQGRPTGFTDEAARAALDAARRGKSKRGCERAAGVGKGTITDAGGWLDQNPTFTDADGEERDFFGAFERARDEGEDRWIEGGALEDSGVDSSFAKFMLASSYDYKKTEKREHSGDGGGPLQIEFSEEIVETDWGESQ